MKIQRIIVTVTALTIVASFIICNTSAVSYDSNNDEKSVSFYDKVSRTDTEYTSELDNNNEESTDPEQTDPTEEPTEQTVQSTSDFTEESSESQTEETVQPSTDEIEPTESTTDPTEESTEETTQEPTDESTNDKELFEETRINLATMVKDLKNLNEDEYTEESFGALKQALDLAEAILSDWDNRYTESKEAFTALEAADKNLVSYMSLLEKAVAEGEKILPDWYTEASFSALETALENGRKAMDSGKVNSTTAKELIAQIEKAINGLYNLKDKLAKSINEAKSKYDLLYVESSLAEFKAEISRIEGEFTENITPDEVKKLIDDVLKAYSLLKCVLGDANLSGSITVQDATALQRYIAGLDLKIEPSLSDVNFDGAITVSDATRIQQYVAKLIDKFEKEPQLPDYEKEWNLVLVNYKYPLKSGYVPKLRMVDGRSVFTFDVRAADALEQMLSDCRAAGLSPLICSSYRTQEIQEKLFNNRVNRYVEQGYSYEKAVELAKTSVAYPGTSEHQLGLAVDIVSLHYQILDEGQLKTKEQQWLMKNCWRYGFILRYPQNKSDITGVIFEPWHYRYVGVDAAKEIMEKGITLEEYLGFI